MMPDTEANNKVTTRMGHDPDKEASRGLDVFLMSLTKNATPGDSTGITKKKH